MRQRSERFTITVSLVLLVGSGALFFRLGGPDQLSAFLIGVLVGVAELLSRYRDAPLSVLRAVAAPLYILVNGGFAVAALWALDLGDPPPVGRG